jgi:hypothetical protein
LREVAAILSFADVELATENTPVKRRGSGIKQPESPDLNQSIVMAQSRSALLSHLVINYQDHHKRSFKFYFAVWFANQLAATFSGQVAWSSQS